MKKILQICFFASLACILDATGDGTLKAQLIGVEKIDKLGVNTLKKFPRYKLNEGLNLTYILEHKNIVEIRQDSLEANKNQFTLSEAIFSKDLSTLLIKINKSNEAKKLEDRKLDVVLDLNIGVHPKEQKLKISDKQTIFQNDFFEILVIGKRIVVKGNAKLISKLEVFEEGKLLISNRESQSEKGLIISYEELSAKSIIHISYFDKVEAVSFLLPWTDPDSAK